MFELATLVSNHPFEARREKQFRTRIRTTDLNPPTSDYPARATYELFMTGVHDLALVLTLGVNLFPYHFIFTI